MYPIVRLVGRIAFAFVVLGSVIVYLKTAESRTPISVQSQPKDRLVTKKPWRVEPVKVISAKSKRKEKIDIGKPFDDDDDWFKGFTVTVTNDSDKNVTAIMIDMIFLRPPGDSRPPYAETLNFGPRPTFPEYSYRDPKKLIRPGQSAELELGEDNYDSVVSTLEKLDYAKPISRIELVIRDIGFEDGTVLRSGTWYEQDPSRPDDPTKKIRVEKPPRRAENVHQSPSHHISRRGISKDAPAAKINSMLKAPGRPPGCYRQLYQPPEACAGYLVGHGGCETYKELLDLSIDDGEYFADIFAVPCQRFVNGALVNCGTTEYMPRYVSCCQALYCGDPEAISANSCSGCPEDYDQIDNCCYPMGDCNWTRQDCENANGFWYNGCCDRDGESPIIIDVAGNGFELTSLSDGVLFDFFGNSSSLHLSWTRTSSDDAWLVLDRNGNGAVENAKELFSDIAPQSQPQAGIARNGFSALAMYDKPAHGGNGDGTIDSRDSVFSSLRLWQDQNHNAISESHELHTLSEFGVGAISLNYKESRRSDQFGNTFRYRAKVYRNGGLELGRWAYDVILVTGERSNQTSTFGQLVATNLLTKTTFAQTSFPASWPKQIY